MAIGTFDAASAGARPPVHWCKALTGTVVAGRPVSTWGLAGFPGAGAFDTTLAGVALSAANGGLTRTNPASGESRFFAGDGISSAQAGQLYLCDRLWHNGGFTITLTTAQTVNSATWPARCPTSAVDETPGTTGFGIYAGLEVSGATGAGTPTLTLSYTNAAGTAGRTATNVQATAATSAAGTFYQFGLQSGDTGVRSIQSLTLSATWTSGTINLVAYRVLASFPLPAAGIPVPRDWLTGGAARVYDSSTLFFLFVPQTTTTTQLSGLYVETQG